MGRRSEGFKLVQYAWSPYWYITWAEDRRSRRCSTGATNREEAERFRANFILEIDRDKKQPCLSVKQAIQDYIAEHAPHTASPDSIEFHSRAVLAHFNHTPIEALTPAKIKEYTAKQKVKPGTIRRQLTVLLASLNHARKEGRLQSVPHIPMPPPPPPKERWLTKQEARKLLKACRTDHIKLFVAIALYTGQRKGAVLDLKWSQIDLQRGMIDFNPVGRAQTSKKRPSVPINEELMPLLKKAGRGKRPEYVIGYKGRGKDGRLGDIKKGFKLACEDAGLKNVTPHTLRHTAATWMAQDGNKMWEISGVMGHSHSRTTEIYAKHSPDYLRDAVASLTLARNLRAKQPKHSKKTGKARN